MSTLSIRELSHSAELDRTKMSAVRGGTFYLPGYNTSLTSFTFNTQQLIGQNQNVFNENGGNVAFSSGVSSNVKPVQKADNVNTVNVFSGGLL